MSDQTIQQSGRQDVELSRVERAGRASPTWQRVFQREFHELWIGGKAPVLLLLFSIVLGFQAYVTGTNVELSLMPPKEMVYELLKTAIAVGLFIGLIIGADSISGERERATLESLLLTPTSRRQVVLGKFLAAISPWPAALLLTIPYMIVLGQEDEVIGQAIPWGMVVGTILAVAYTGLGMLVSFWCNTNRTSYLVSLGIYILVLVPAQLPGRAQTGYAGQFLQWVNPLAATNHFLSKILVNNRTFEEFGNWLTSPIVFASLILILLLLVSAPRLRLEAGLGSRLRPMLGRIASRAGRGTRLLALAIVFLSLAGSVSTALALPETQSYRQQGADPEPPLQISLDTPYAVVKMGDPIFFDTVVTNTRAENSPPTIVAMNIINLDKEGDVVDPEDWSPERTQYIDRLGPGESATLSWRVNAILDGDYIVYMVAMPEPAGQEATSHAVASPGLHLTVAPFTRLNPRGIVPLAIGVPIAIGLGILLIFVLRRRGIDTGGSKTKNTES